MSRLKGVELRELWRARLQRFEGLGQTVAEFWVAVGTAIAGRPPHGSVRAALPHTAPTLGVWRENEYVGAGAPIARRDPSLKEFSELGPGHSTVLAASANALVPATDDFAVKGLHGRAIAENGVVVGVTTHDPLERGADLIEGLMTSDQQQLTQFGQFGARSFRDRVAQWSEVAFRPVWEQHVRCYQNQQI